MTSSNNRLTICDLRFTIVASNPTEMEQAMYIGRVSGTVVATIKHEVFNGRKLLVVDKLTTEGEPTGSYDICIDAVQAGVGDTVLVIDEGNGARQILRRQIAPVRAVVVGVVDDVEVKE